MGAEAESNEEKRTTAGGGGAPVRTGRVSDSGGAADGDGKLSHGEEKKSPMAMGMGGGKKEGYEVKGMLSDDDIASTLAAASEKLQKAHRNEQAKQIITKKKKRKPSMSRCLLALSPKRLFAKLRDLYVNGCLMAADNTDFADLATGAPAMYYADTTMSRNVSQRRDREREEIMQVSLSRQQSRQSQSANMSRNASTPLSRLSRNPSAGFPGGLSRNTSTGFSAGGTGGLSRNASTGLLELNRQTSRRTPFVRSSPSRKNSELFSAGRASFVQQHQNSASSLARFGDTNPFSVNSTGGAALSKTEFRPNMNIDRPIKEDIDVGNTPK